MRYDNISVLLFFSDSSSMHWFCFHGLVMYLLSLIAFRTTNWSKQQHKFDCHVSFGWLDVVGRRWSRKISEFHRNGNDTKRRAKSFQRNGYGEWWTWFIKTNENLHETWPNFVLYLSPIHEICVFFSIFFAILYSGPLFLLELDCAASALNVSLSVKENVINGTWMSGWIACDFDDTTKHFHKSKNISKSEHAEWQIVVIHCLLLQTEKHTHTRTNGHGAFVCVCVCCGHFRWLEIVKLHTLLWSKWLIHCLMGECIDEKSQWQCYINLLSSFGTHTHTICTCTKWMLVAWHRRFTNIVCN